MHINTYVYRYMYILVIINTNRGNKIKFNTSLENVSWFGISELWK